MFRRKNKITVQHLVAAFNLGVGVGRNEERDRIAVGLAAIAPTGDQFEAPKTAVEAVLFPAEDQEKD